MEIETLNTASEQNEDFDLAAEDSLSNTECTHCGLPIPAGLIEANREAQFCCGGCKAAYELIYSNGLSSFYRMSDGAAVERSLQHRSVAESQFAGYDNAVFQEKFTKRISANRQRIELAVEGMHCGACIWLLEKLPSIVPGVTEARVNWGRRSITVQWQSNQVSLSKIAATINQLGYPPSALQTSDSRQRWKVENHKHLIRIGVATACAGNNMIISGALYLGMFAHMSAGMTQFMRVASAIIGIAALLWPGRSFLTSAIAAIRTKTPHMDLPIALALVTGTTAGIVNVIRGSGEIYFDSLSVLICLLLIGRWFQFRQQSKAASAVELLHQLTPQKVLKVVDGDVVETLVELIQPNDLVQVHCGDLFPADGTVVDYAAEVDEAILTGESAPVTKTKGSHVYAGTANVGSTVVMSVSKIGSETRIGSLVELVEQAAHEKPKLVLWANRIGGNFVVSVMVLATTTFFWWLPFSVEVAIDRAVALLVVACPCALALATPLTIAVALGRAAKRKIMIKGGDALQTLQEPGMIWLDKTGTVTDGLLKVNRWYGSSHWLPRAIKLEKQFTHPVAKAIVEFGTKDVLSADEIELAPKQKAIFELSMWVIQPKNCPGRGVRGIVGFSDIVIGSTRLLDESGVPISRAQQRIADRIVSRGCSPCWLAVDGRVVGVFELADSIRPEAKEAIDSLKGRGWKVGLLSGDHQEIVDRVSQRLGIERCYSMGGTTPEEKFETIKRSISPVVMIGDGVNDSAALAAADVGIAVKNSAEASLAAAPIYLGSNGLNPILDCLSISDSMSRTMRLNLGVSLAYNLTFAALAFCGHITPLSAAILMPISSLTVVAMSLGAGRNSQPITTPDLFRNREF